MIPGFILGDSNVAQSRVPQCGLHKHALKKCVVSHAGLADVDHHRVGPNPLRSYYASLIETKVFPGPNPASDLRYFVGKGAHRKARRRITSYFAQEEGPQLVATAKALFPRWHALILTGLVGGLRWGESAALHKTDIDWTRGRIHVQRTWSEKGNRIEACKDGEDRWVKASPALLAALRDHIGKVDLEGQVRNWTPDQRQLVFPNKAGRVTHYGAWLEHVWQSQLRHMPPFRWSRSSLGATADGARFDWPDRRHPRTRAARAP